VPIAVHPMAELTIRLLMKQSVTERGGLGARTARKREQDDGDQW
jgi:hypothetical protein